MKLATTLVVSLGLLFVACDKKKEEGTVQKQDPGVAQKPTEPPPPPPVTPLTGTALADKYKACVEMINSSKLDEFGKDCVDESYTLHGFAGMPEQKGAGALLSWFKGQKTAFPDWKLQPQLIIVSGRNLLAVNFATG